MPSKQEVVLVTVIHELVSFPEGSVQSGKAARRGRGRIFCCEAQPGGGTRGT